MAASACENGFYSVEGLTSCTECQEGFECPSIYNDWEIACTAGFYSASGQSKCTICPAGSFCSGGTKRNDCATPKWSIQGSSKCNDCPIGYSCLDPSQRPQICELGFYSDSSTAGTCASCNTGAFCPPGSTTSIGYSGEVPNGFYVSASGFAPCASTNFGGGGDATSCEICPAGYACPEATPGVNSTNARVPKSTFACQAGYYSML